MTPQIIKREAWGTTHELPKYRLMYPAKTVFIHQSNTNDTNNVYNDMQTCEQIWSNIQSNYFIHPSGTILENTGFYVSHEYSTIIYIVWIGDYSSGYPTSMIINQTAELIKTFIEHGYLEKDAAINTYTESNDRVFNPLGQYIHSALPTIRALVQEKDSIEMVCTKGELEKIVRAAVRAELKQIFPEQFFSEPEPKPISWWENNVPGTEERTPISD